MGLLYGLLWVDPALATYKFERCLLALLHFNNHHLHDAAYSLEILLSYTASSGYTILLLPELLSSGPVCPCWLVLLAFSSGFLGYGSMVLSSLIA